MAGTVETDLAFFNGLTSGSTSNCDAITDWSGSPTLDTESFIQGTGCLSKKVSNATSIHVFSFASAVDLTDKCLYVWMMCLTPGILGTKANGGLRIRVEDASANWGEWYVGGKDTYKGGWECFVVHTGQTFDNKSATAPTISAITKAGVVFYTTATTAKTNCLWDALRYGTYLSIRGGTSGSPGTFQDFLDAESNVSNRWGVVSEYAGIILVQGKLKFGSATAGQDTYFKDTSSPVITFRDRPVPSSWYDIELRGNSTGDTQIYFGEKVGGNGVSGPIIKAESSSILYTITASDTNVDYYGFYGTTLIRASTVTLQAYSANKEFLNCSLIGCDEMLPDTGIVKNTNFISSPGRACRISSTSHHVTDCQFINCQTAVHHDATGTYTYDGLKFYGGTYHVENSTSGSITINCANGSNPDPAKVNNSGGGSTVINNVVLLTIYVKDQRGDGVQGARCYIEKASDHTELMNELSDENGVAQESFNYPGDTDIIWRVRKSSSYPKFIPAEGVGTITAAGFSLIVTMVDDLIA